MSLMRDPVFNKRESELLKPALLTTGTLSGEKRYGNDIKIMIEDLDDKIRVTIPDF